MKTTTRAITYHENCRLRQLRALQSEKRRYVAWTAALLVIAAVVLMACQAKAAQNDGLRDKIALLRKEYEARRRAEFDGLVIRGYCLAHDVRRCGQDVSKRALWEREDLRVYQPEPIPFFRLSEGREDAPFSYFPPVEDASRPALDFELRDFIACHIQLVQPARSTEEAEMLADACMTLPGSDPLRWCALMRAESSYRLSVKNYLGCYGVFQINEPVHRRRLRSLGLDIHNSFSDQVTYAGLLYDERGWRPWADSRRNTLRYLDELKVLWDSQPHQEAQAE